MVPKSVLNDLRRRAVEELLRATLADVGATTDDSRRSARTRLRCRRSPSHAVKPAEPARTVELLRARPHAGATRSRARLAAGAPLARPAMVYCDFEDVRRYREAVAMARAAGMPIGLGDVADHQAGRRRFAAADRQVRARCRAGAQSRGADVLPRARCRTSRGSATFRST